MIVLHTGFAIMAFATARLAGEIALFILDVKQIYYTAAIIAAIAMHPAQTSNIVIMVAKIAILTMLIATVTEATTAKHIY